MDLSPLEARCLTRLREARPFPPRDPTNPDAWLEFSVHAALSAALKARNLIHAVGIRAKLKEDGSPATELERDMEDTVRRALAEFAPHAEMTGEESGGRMRSEGDSLAMDPIDGTWAFLTQTESYSVTISVFRDGVPMVCVVANPASGEVAYVAPIGRPRLIRLGLLNAPDGAVDLPFQAPDEKKILVHLQPSPGGGAISSAFQRAWEARTIQMVRSSGGSPAWALVEAAKGHFVYVNRWSRRPAEPWDLVGGVEIVRKAGGDVVNLEGSPIDTLSHSGPFVAGLSAKARTKVAEISRAALGGDS